MKLAVMIVAMVVALGLLAAIIIPIFGSNIECGPTSVEHSNVRQVCLAIMTYSNKHETLPNTIHSLLLEAGLVDERIDAFVSEPNFIYLHPNASVDQFDANTPIIFYQIEHGAWVGFFDGHVTWYETDELLSDENLRVFAPSRETTTQ